MLNSYHVIESILQEFSQHLRIFEVDYSGKNICIKDFITYKIAPPYRFHYMSQKRLSEYFMARLCAKYALNKFNYYEPLKLHKSLTGRIIWPNNFIGSVSHTDNIAIACIARVEKYTHIGIDIEKIVDYKLFNQLKELVLLKDEIKLINSFANSNLSLEVLFTLIFSAKETLFKAISSIIDEKLDFHSAQVIEIKEEYIILRLNIVLTKEFILPYATNIYYKIAKNHVYTLCYF